MPISHDNLRDSRIGRVIMFMFKNEQELPEMRKIAGSLITHWSRPMMETHAHLHHEQRAPAAASVRDMYEIVL